VGTSTLRRAVYTTGGSEPVQVDSDKNLRRGGVGNDSGRVAQLERMVVIFEDLVVVTEPVQLRAKFRHLLSMVK
jgi:hypothetical protein